MRSKTTEMFVSSVPKNIFGKPVMFPPVFREREASSLFRRGQRQSTPSFTAKSYFRWKFIALPRIEASFPAERNKESVSTATRAKDNWHAILSCPFSPAGRSLLARSQPRRFLSGRAVRLRKLTIVKCTYASADLFPGAFEAEKPGYLSSLSGVAVNNVFAL